MSNKPIVLTEGQQIGLSTIMKFLDDPDEKSMLVKGYAGTGKTTLIQHAIGSLSGQFRVAFTAPTNKATRVLKEMAAKSGVSVDEVVTIFSLLNLKLMPDGAIKTLGKGSFGSRMGEYQIVVMDEASMASNVLMRHINEDLHSLSVKLIKMGDPLQLPPVGEEESSAFTGDKYVVNLEEITRQAKDNPIISLTADIRESILRQEQTFSFQTKVGPGGEGVYVLERPKWESWMRAGFSGEAYKHDKDSFRTVAWRNVSVDYYNDRVRQAIYGAGSDNRYLPGEYVINAEPVLDEFGTEIVAPTDSEGVIVDVEIVSHPYELPRKFGDFKVYHLSIRYEGYGLADAFVIHKDSLGDYNRQLDSLAEQAKKDRKVWKTFWAFKECFNDIRPAYAITAHRSQGSTYQNVFVDVADIRKNLNWVESMKCLYVACSRASKNLMILL